MKSPQQHSSSQPASHSHTPFFAPVVQPKLTVNQPGDEYEREADAAADQVMRMPSPLSGAAGQGNSGGGQGNDDASTGNFIQRKPIPLTPIQRKCAECEKEEKEGVQRKEKPGVHFLGNEPIVVQRSEMEEEEQVQRKETAGQAGGQSAPPIVSDVLASGGGRPMDGDTKGFMESRFGQDFSQVRIHTDSRAAESAAAIQAKAYTSGRDVVFGAGEYQPGSDSGKRLLAHELVHVGQQGKMENNTQISRTTLEERLPREASLENASASFRIPANSMLSQADGANIQTERATTVTITVTSTGVSVRLNPPLLISITGLTGFFLTDNHLQGFNYSFGPGRITWVGLDGDISDDDVRSGITAFWTSIIRGTRVQNRGYNPLTDPDLGGTVSQLRANFAVRPSTGGGLTPRDITGANLSAEINLRAPIQYGDSNGRVRLSGNFRLNLQFQGSGSDIQQNPLLERLSIIGGSIIVTQGGADVARIQSVYLRPGGRIEIGNITLLGQAQDVAEGETLARALWLILILSGGSPDDRPALAGRNPHLEPELTTAGVSGMISTGFRNALIQLIRENRTSVTDVDLARFFGVESDM